MAEASSECVQTVTALLTTLTASGRLSYKFSVVAVGGGSDAFAPRVKATFSKPEPRAPAPTAVARLYFHLEGDRQHVRGFTVEQDPHFHALDAVRWDEAVLDRVVRRKLQLRSEQLVDLSDEFASTRAPSAQRARQTEAREREKESTEEELLEQLQRYDTSNDGRLPLAVVREALAATELSLPPGMPREVLLALVSVDREGLVEYGEFVGVAAEAVDSMADARDELVGDAKEVENLEEEEQALDAFELLSARQTRYTEEKLTELLDARIERRAVVASALAARRSTTRLVRPQDVVSTLEEDAEEDEEEDEEEDDELAHGEELEDGDEEEHNAPEDEDGDHQQLRRRSSVSQRKRHVTRQQLQEVLETPQLLLSRAEVNLMLALAESVVDDTAGSSAVEEVACAPLGALLRRVRRLIFRFQCRAFRDRTEAYLLRQLRAFENNSLQGSSRHLKQRLTQKETKAVVRDLQKLLLTPYQVMQLVALSEERPGVPEHLVYYKNCVPPMARRLQELVDVNRLVEQAALLHNMEEPSDFTAVPLPSEDIVRQTSYRCFEAFDLMQRGVVSIEDFQAGLKLLAETQGLPVDSAWEMKQLAALADPNGSGRVNYALFQHLLYPLMLVLYQERELTALQDDGRTRQDANGVEAK